MLSYESLSPVRCRIVPELPLDIVGGIDAYLRREGPASPYHQRRMEDAALEVWSQGQTDHDLILGWAIVSEAFEEWLNIEQLQPDQVFSADTIRETRRRFAWFTGDAARYLQRQRGDSFIRTTIRRLLRAVGVKTSPPRTLRYFYDPLHAYVQQYLDDRDPSRRRQIGINPRA
mgnify:FL=1